MDKIIEQIKRFQELGNKTGRSKMSSFSVSLDFNPDFFRDGNINICLGGYDVSGFGRNHFTESTEETLLEDLTAVVDKACATVAEDTCNPAEGNL
jgi:hypothetical protein